MKATSVQNIKNVKDVCFSIENHPLERESKLTIVASTDDDIFTFEFEGSDLLQSCKRSGLFTGWEKDQKIRELEAKSKDISNDNALLLETNKKLKKEKEEYEKKVGELEKDLKEIQEAFPNLPETPITDNVNHPYHYKTGKFECIEVMQEVFGINAVRDFCKCNAFKYVYRIDRKNGDEDTKKAIWYLNKYLELEEKIDIYKEVGGLIPRPEFVKDMDTEEKSSKGTELLSKYHDPCHHCVYTNIMMSEDPCESCHLFSNFEESNNEGEIWHLNKEINGDSN